MGRRVRRFALVSLFILSAFPFAFLHAQEAGTLIEELKLFSKAIGVICEAYPEDVKPRNLLYEAAKGMLSSLDKYSQFVDPELYKLVQIHMKGEYAGIGAILQMVDGKIGIRGLEPGKPAEMAGLHVGDIILKIDGVSIEKKQVADVSALLRGEADTPVVVTILRGPPAQVLDITIQRKIIEIKAVQDSRMVGKSLAYFRLSAWQEHTTTQTEKTLDDLTKQGMKALIVDLRNNDGGLLTQAVSLAEKFLEKDKKIVSVLSKIAEQRKEYFNSQKGKYLKLPMVILVNDKSASASEVFTGALQDHKRATIVGVQTFGKGSVQSMIPFDDVSALKLTTAKYVTPSGKVIDKVGLTPDKVVPNDPEGTPGNDRQILEAIAIFKEFM